MASISFPRPDYNGGIVTEYEHELLTRRSISDGVHGGPTDPAPVIADAAVRTVRLRANTYASVRGSVFHSGDSDIVLPQLAANTSGNPRIDLVVLRLDRADYSINPVVITGTPAGNPVAPSPIRNTGSTGFYDLPLAEVRVDHNEGVLAAGDVTTKCWYVGSDGQIRCTPTTRPPVEAGRTFWEHPTGRYYVSNGDQWLVAVEDGGKASLSINTTLFVGSHYNLYRRNGWAWAELTAMRPGGALAANTLYKVATVPAGYRPPVLFQFPGVVPSSGGVIVGTVAPDGTVSINPGALGINAGRSFVCALGTWPIAS